MVEDGLSISNNAAHPMMARTDQAGLAIKGALAAQ